MGKIAVAIALVVVVAILLAGFYTMWKGGDVSRVWSNRLMRARVLAQFIAILIIMLVLYLSGAGRH
ncbi:MAG: twin transmembrane helix small protein [Alphaproteobacteria bacterium]|nr:twin transmembrane helix small protein [Alphaproteobacteria bacterium]